ncbi:PhzF family phenazine biosynthesis protein [Paenibacillus sp. DMB20]|uniref:PhzF family phenazine biosynthesis protein n=1 Tax=Paenibacillus sp. DMB20 TaxID=1642570 RepID=UPI0006274E6B|nr:PhzF family phenazine biosynthesis protein [Paenibacillus sp. DMB20]KKO54429.1 oxidoreductase [Paenibacillus sp. DMB20]
MKIYVADAFTDQPYHGNPARVCIMQAAKPDSWMQHIAAEMNLSETAFLLEQGDSYRLRWFTPKAEVDLCGHATLASAHILWEKGLTNEAEIRFTTKSGLLTASKQKDGWICLNFPLEPESPCIPPQALIDGLGTDYVYIGKNRMDYLVELESEEMVRNLTPDFNLWKSVEARGVIVTSKSGREGVDFVSRCFYPAVGVNEDPVTGSAHCCLGPYWQKRMNRNELTAKQISARTGTLKLKVNPERIDIMGQAVTTLSGTLETETN